MRMLIVAATAAELGPCLARVQSAGGIDMLVTGVGMVATAARCAKALAGRQYDLALNLGVCGSFDPQLEPGTVVHVVSDAMPELGAEDGDDFLSLQQLQLLRDDDFPFRGGKLLNDHPPALPVLDALPRVAGITVNTVHGNERSIAAVIRRCEPQVESMEGAAFMYACLLEGVPFAQIRAVSNIVERRNRGAWRLREAIDNLSAVTLDILQNV